MRIFPLSEGRFTVDQTKEFLPFDPESDALSGRPSGSLMVEVQPFLIETSEDLILLDAGLGFQEEGVLQLHRNIRREGFSPDRVTKVLMTHLHKDHSGGLFIHQNNGAIELSFPTADIYIQGKELEWALEKGGSSYRTTELNLLRTHPKVHFVQGDGIIDGYIKYQLTGAHSPFHQVFWIVDGGERAFFGGDEAPQLVQMKNRFTAKYDFDGRKSMLLRQQWWSEGLQQGWSFLFYHDIKTPVFPLTA
jgi:glyoxylase-like metal-dependent hydrolase (beta-lactamase superfamily II)